MAKNPPISLRMKNSFVFPIITTVSVALNLSLAQVPKANAATFNFTFDDLIYGDIGSGSLSFTDAESSLSKTNGTGTFQLSDLGSSAAFNFSVLSSSLGITHTAPASGTGPLFQFDEGDLVGLSFSDTEQEPSLDIESVLLVERELFLIGPGIDGVPILGASFGLVNFETVQPWIPVNRPIPQFEPAGTLVATGDSGSLSDSSAAVPEPSTVFGLTVSIGLGIYTRRRSIARRKWEI